MEFSARITFTQGVNVGKETARLINTVRSWTCRDYSVEVASSGSGRWLDLMVRVTPKREFAQPHHLAGGVHDALVALACSSFSIET